VLSDWVFLSPRLTILRDTLHFSRLFLWFILDNKKSWQFLLHFHT